MVQKYRVSKALGLQACRLLEARRLDLMMKYDSAAAIPKQELGPYFRITVSSNYFSGSIVKRFLTIVQPANDREALCIIRDLEQFKPLVDECFVPKKEPLPDEKSHRWPWVKNGWYYYDAIGRLHWKNLCWERTEAIKEVSSHFMKLMLEKGKKPWQLGKDDYPAEIYRVFKHCPGPLRTIYFVVEYCGVELALADLTKFRMPNNTYDDERLCYLYAIAIAHRIARDSKIRSYAAITGTDVEKYGQVNVLSCISHAHFSRYVQRAINDGLLPKNLRTLRGQIREGVALGIEIVIDEIKRRNNSPQASDGLVAIAAITASPAK